MFFLIGIALSAAGAEAQQPKKLWRIGLLSSSSPSLHAPRLDALRQGLRELGYVEGQNIIMEYRYAEGKRERLPNLAAELVRLKVDVIVTGGTRVTAAAKQPARSRSSWGAPAILLRPVSSAVLCIREGT